MALQSLHMIISGRVQGVGFRYFALEEALAMDLTGYVKNLHNGDVEIYAEGPEDRLKVFYEEMRKGPSLSRVIQVKEEWQALSKKDHKGFQITY